MEENIDKNANDNSSSSKSENINSKTENNDLENEQRNISKSNNINVKPIKEPPIEKKPFEVFINSHLIPTLKEEFNKRGLEINDINLKNTNRPITGDKCWVIYCEIKAVCNFWLSFEKDDITSTKSISLSKSNQSPSVIESFLIDEKITLQLITSRIIQD